MEIDQSEISFLYDQLQRHQTELFKYQSLHQRIDINDIDYGEERKNVFSDKRLLYPLLIEYDKTISSLLMENSTLKKTCEELKGQLEGLITENESIIRRLKETLHIKSLSTDLACVQESMPLTSASDDLVLKLQQQVNIAMEAQMQCDHKDEELVKMQEVINKLINDAGVKARQEVDSVRKQSNKQISKLTEELNRLEMENAERQAQFDRQFREKKALESELDKLYREGMIQGSQEKGSLQHLNQRAMYAEEVINKLNIKLENLQAELQREKLKSEEMCIKMSIQLDQLKDCNVTLESSIEKAHNDCFKYQGEINKLKKNMQILLQEKETLQRDFQKEISTIEHDNLMKIRTYEVKIQTTDDANRHAISELRKILTAQQRMTSRWKEEYHAMTKKFETKMQDLRATMVHKEKQNEEVKFLLKESNHRTHDVLNTLLEANGRIRRMEEKVKESEEIASDKTEKLAQAFMKSKKLENEKQTLSKELLRLKRDMSSSI